MSQCHLDRGRFRIFVGGLPYSTDDLGLRKFGEQFGTVTSAIVMRDPIKERSRGFGFISFEDQASLGHALQATNTSVGRRKVEIKLAVPRDHENHSHNGQIFSNERQSSVNVPREVSNDQLRDSAREQSSETNKSHRKIFCGGLHYSSREDSVGDYFGKFGAIESVQILYNRETQRSRGFGFVVFCHEASVDRVLMHRMHYIDGKQVEVKPAVPKQTSPELQGESTSPMLTGSASSTGTDQRPLSATYTSSDPMDGAATPQYGGPVQVVSSKQDSDGLLRPKDEQIMQSPLPGNSQPMDPQGTLAAALGASFGSLTGQSNPKSVSKAWQALDDWSEAQNNRSARTRAYTSPALGNMYSPSIFQSMEEINPFGHPYRKFTGASDAGMEFSGPESAYSVVSGLGLDDDADDLEQSHHVSGDPFQLPKREANEQYQSALEKMNSAEPSYAFKQWTDTRPRRQSEHSVVSISADSVSSHRSATGVPSIADGIVLGGSKWGASPQSANNWNVLSHARRRANSETAVASELLTGLQIPIHGQIMNENRSRLPLAIPESSESETPLARMNSIGTRSDASTSYVMDGLDRLGLHA